MIIKPVSQLVQELDAKSITVIGNPCADGLGVDALRLFHAGLSGAEGDLIIIPGDVSPQGFDPFYSSVYKFIEHTSPAPVHVMRGNHDGDDFVKYFGHSDRAVLSEHFVLVMLDNSQRRFSRETLDFLRETLAIMDSRNIVVAFHYPPPNRVSGNSLGAEEWKEFEDAVGVWRNRISLLLCGHDHSYYEDDIDGLRLVVTGCGGSSLVHLDRVASASHHVVEIRLDSPEGPQVFRRAIANIQPDRSDEAQAILAGAYRFASLYHVNLRLWGEEEENRPELARLYAALSEACMAGARIIRRLKEVGPTRRFVLDPSEPVGMKPYSESEIRSLLDRENDEVAVRALSVAARVEVRLKSLLADARKKIEAGDDLDPTGYYLCHSCGMLYAGDLCPDFCQECGAPDRFIHELFT